MKETILSPEERFLILCARIKIDEQTKDQINALLNHGIDWQRLKDLSNYHYITPLVYHHLNKINYKFISKEFLLFARAKTDECIAKNLLLWRELNLILSSFNEIGLKAIPMKGILFVENLYKNLALRELGDLDILVQKKDLVTVDRCIRKLGYEPLDTPFKWEDHIMLNYYQKFIYHFSYQKIEPHLSLPLTLEIHFDILPPLQSRKSFLSDIWANAKDINISDMNVLAMSLEDLLIYLSIKFFSNLGFYTMLRDLCDISELIRYYNRQIDWNKIVKKAKSYNVASFVYYSLYLTKELLMEEDDLIPKNTFLKLKPCFLKRTFLDRIITKERVLTGKHTKNNLPILLSAYIFDIMSFNGFRYTLRSILNILYNYDFEKKIFGVSKYKRSVFYFLRFIQLPFLLTRLSIRSFISVYLNEKRNTPH